MQYIVYFEEQTRPKDPDEQRVLLYDNYGSYTFKEFIVFVTKHKIKVQGLQPHTSHFIQPLDVILFQQYKYYYRRAVIEAIYYGISEFRVIEFISVLDSIRKKSLTIHSIRQGFKKSSIQPINRYVPIAFIRKNYSGTQTLQQQTINAQRIKDSQFDKATNDAFYSLYGGPKILAP